MDKNYVPVGRIRKVPAAPREIKGNGLLYCRVIWWQYREFSSPSEGGCNCRQTWRSAPLQLKPFCEWMDGIVQIMMAKRLFSGMQIETRSLVPALLFMFAGLLVLHPAAARAQSAGPAAASVPASTTPTLEAALLLPSKPVVSAPAKKANYVGWAEVVTPRVEVGQPIWIRFRAKKAKQSDSRTALEITWDVGKDIEAIIQYPGHPPVRLQSPFPLNLTPVSTLALLPGEERTIETWLLYVPEATSGMIFEGSGNCAMSLRMRYAVEHDPVIAELPYVPIEVLPAGPDETPALKFLIGQMDRDLDRERALVRDLQAGLATEETAPLMEALRKQAPRSSLAALALFSLARREFQQMNYSKAIAMANQFADEYPSHPLVDDILLSEVLALQNLKDDEATREAALRLFLGCPNGDRRPSSGPLYVHWIEPVLRPAHPALWMLFEPDATPTMEEWIALQKAHAGQGRDSAAHEPHSSAPPPELQTLPSVPSMNSAVPSHP